jgi:hypothetical protein
MQISDCSGFGSSVTFLNINVGTWLAAGATLAVVSSLQMQGWTNIIEYERAPT